MSYKNIFSGHRRRIVTTLVLVIAVSAIVGGVVGTRHKAPSQQQQMQQLVAQVDKLIELPTGENPTVATVTDQAAVRNQPFFVQAKTGDKVLLYTGHHYAYLYRPSSNKLINVGPINGTVSYTQFSVALRNGTPQSDLMETVAAKLQNSFPNGKLTEKTAAQRTTYPSTIVIPMKDSDDVLATQVADTLGGQVGILPIGESKSPADLLIIIGQDYKQ